jgi:hypothetical protein
MPKQFLVLLLPVAFTGCSVGHVKLPMTLGPSSAPTSCVTSGGSSSYGDCKRAGEVAVPKGAK